MRWPVLRKNIFKNGKSLFDIFKQNTKTSELYFMLVLNCLLLIEHNHWTFETFSQLQRCWELLLSWLSFLYGSSLKSSKKTPWFSIGGGSYSCGLTPDIVSSGWALAYHLFCCCRQTLSGLPRAEILTNKLRFSVTL